MVKRLQSSTGANPASYSYDAAGNRSNDNGWVQTYSNAGRLLQSVKGNTTVTYRYNALGQRVSKTSGGVTTYFVYDTAGHLLGEYYADGKAIQETVWLGDTPVAVVKPSADPQNPSISYIWADHLNTPRQISDPTSQAILWRWDGEPFGADLANENPSGKGQYVYNLRFPGQYFDKETSKHYNYFRDYDPQTGRYVQSDPIGLAGGINTYAYVRGNPLIYSDSRGLEVDICCRTAEILGGIVKHCWLKTDTKIAGMASSPQCRKNVGNQFEPLFITKVYVSDHSCEKAESCTPVDPSWKVDEQCVNKELDIGKPIGRFNPTNNCQTFVQSTLLKCSTIPPHEKLWETW